MKKLFALLIFSTILFISCSDDDETIPNFTPENVVLGTDIDNVSFMFDGNTFDTNINITCNTKWTARTDAPWITLSAKSGDGDTSIRVAAGENTEQKDLTSQIVIKAGEKDSVIVKVVQRRRPAATGGLYILSEGTWNRNQAELAYYNMETGALEKKIFETRNSVKLGDTGNDLAIYGGKMYCVVSGASVETGGGHLEVIDPATGISIKRIPFKDQNGDADQPRKIAFYKNKAYVTGFSGCVARIDTASLSIDKYAPLSGDGTEGITQYDGKLFVCNSGKGSGTTISVLDIASFAETKTVTVPRNPRNIAVSKTGVIYFSTDMLYDTGDPSGLHSMDVNTGNITTYNTNGGRLAIGKNDVYVIETDYTTYGSLAKKLNLATKEIGDFTTQLPDFFMGYSVSVNPLDGSIYAMGQGQDVSILDAEGNLIKTLKVGTGFGSTVVPVYKY